MGKSWRNPLRVAFGLTDFYQICLPTNQTLLGSLCFVLIGGGKPPPPPPLRASALSLPSLMCATLVVCMRATIQKV